eukprot:jgi/Mesvir1/29071/Mv18378-RA.1
MRELLLPVAIVFAISTLIAYTEASLALPSIKDHTLIGWKGELRRAPDANDPEAKKKALTRDFPGLPEGSWVEFLGWKPRAWLFHHFLTDEECDEIIKVASSRLVRSTVVDARYKTEMKSTVDNIRTSSGTFIGRGENEVVDRVKDRIAQFTFLPVENGEALQVLHYGEGQEYKAHQDTFPETMLDSSGHRYATTLMFLNTPEEGGETVFTLAQPGPHQDPATWSKCGMSGLGVKPHKGDLLLFWDLSADGKPDPYSTHYACPVTKGEKWSAPLWIHVKSFEQRAAISRKGASICKDQEDSCGMWATSGECAANRPFMIGSLSNPGSCIDSCKKVAPELVQSIDFKC